MEPKTACEHQHDVQIVDVRELDEWEAGHIEGAVHIPMSSPTDVRTSSPRIGRP